jgi:hypothetical protein
MEMHLGSAREKELKENLGGGWKGKKETYWPFLFGWCSKGTKDGFELIHVTLSREVRRSKHQLCKDAADGPNINGSTVVPTTEQQFWRPIPSRRHKHIRPEGQ